MSPEEQRQFIARMKERGQDTSEFEAAMALTAGGRGRGRESATTDFQPKYGVQNAETIDALFAPLPAVESRGRIWIFADKQLKPVDVRLGITDGTFTELLDAESLDANAQVVTGMTGLPARPQAGAAAPGNPFQGGGRGGGRGGPGGRGF